MTTNKTNIGRGGGAGPIVLEFSYCREGFEYVLGYFQSVWNESKHRITLKEHTGARTILESNPTPPMRIKLWSAPGDGNVGVGITDPAAKLRGGATGMAVVE